MTRVANDKIDLLTPLKLRAQIFKIGSKFSTDYNTLNFVIQKLPLSWNFQIFSIFSKVSNWVITTTGFRERH